MEPLRFDRLFHHREQFGTGNTSDPARGAHQEIIARDLDEARDVLIQHLIILKDFLKAEDCLILTLVDVRTCFTDRVAEGWTPDVDAVIGQLFRMPCGEADLSGRG